MFEIAGGIIIAILVIRFWKVLLVALILLIIFFVIFTTAHKSLNFIGFSDPYTSISGIIIATSALLLKSWVWNNLCRAIGSLKTMVEQSTREQVPLDLATTQMMLGYNYSTLGNQENGTESLTKAVIAYQVALQELSNKNLTIQYIITQITLGESYLYRLFLRKRLLAMVQFELGVTYGQISKRENETENLQKSITYLQDALEEYTQEGTPHQWALTQMNIGSAYVRLGELESGTQTLIKAVKICQAGLEKYDPEWLDWQQLSTEFNICVAYFRIGERETGTEHLQKTIIASQIILEKISKKTDPFYWRKTQVILAFTHKELGSGLIKLN